MSEALRLADLLEERSKLFKEERHQAAAELRRLVAENEALKAELAEQARVNGMGGEREARLMALNTELVDALRWYVDTDEVMEMEGNEFWLDGRERARAALAKVEASK